MDRPRRNVQLRTHPDGTQVRSYGEAATAGKTVATDTDTTTANTSTNTNTISTSTAATNTNTNTNTGMNAGTNTSSTRETNNNITMSSMNPTQGGDDDDEMEIILMDNDDNKPVYTTGRIDPIMRWCTEILMLCHPNHSIYEEYIIDVYHPSNRIISMAIRKSVA